MQIKPTLPSASVLVVGTHADQVSDQQVYEVESQIRIKFERQNTPGTRGSPILQGRQHTAVKFTQCETDTIKSSAIDVRWVYINCRPARRVV